MPLDWMTDKYYTRVNIEKRTWHSLWDVQPQSAVCFGGLVTSWYPLVTLWLMTQLHDLFVIITSTWITNIVGTKHRHCLPQKLNGQTVRVKWVSYLTHPSTLQCTLMDHIRDVQYADIMKGVFLAYFNLRAMFFILTLLDASKIQACHFSVNSPFSCPWLY